MNRYLITYQWMTSTGYALKMIQVETEDLLDDFDLINKHVTAERKQSGETYIGNNFAILFFCKLN